MTQRPAPPGPRHGNDAARAAMRAAAALAVCACVLCTIPPRQVQVTVVERMPWTTATLGYAAYDSAKVIAETGRLQKALDAASDTSKTAPGARKGPTPARREILTRLFELAVHSNNPRPDYHRACALASVLRQQYPDSGSYYANWERALAGLVETTDRVDSLRRAVEDASRSGQAQRTSASKSKHAIDSLSAVIAEQKKAIDAQGQTLDGLKKLELRMEQQRRKVE